MIDLTGWSPPKSMLDGIRQRAEAERDARRAQRAPTRDAKRRFRSSIAWKRTRYRVLAENAAKHGGIARCELCGSPGSAEAPLHIDHRQPLAKRWDLRFEPSNLRVLCADCNVGKLDGPDFGTETP